ncbi:MAG: ATP-grasp domain-containing protein [Serratia sp. (in: enterobacteria)]|uniref:ATP-grasp domain-containing protein n=1 Tax=Serratia sp. (in: enterobacteria) TaxID=616 RepID=UPI003F2F3185
MQIIYPSDYFSPGKADETFELEFNCAKNNGLTCLLLSSEHAAMGKYQFSQSFEPGVPVIWRGWMLSTDEYQQLHRAVARCGGQMLESFDDYIRCHYISGWYDICQKYTPETVLVSAEADFDKLTDQLKWPRYFVKDYVKSLTTSRGSVAANADEIREVLQSIEHFRGKIEGGVSLRRFEHFVAESERRYFSLNGQVYSADGVIPDVVIEIAQLVDAPFFSIDMVENDVGQLRLVEIGDGQVSDIKEWPVERFVRMFIAS